MTAAAPTMAPRAQVNMGFVVLISVAAALGGFLFGFDSAVVNGAVPGIQVSFNSTSAQLGFQVASLLLGAAVGGLLAGPLSDRIGRRSTMLAAGGLFLVTAVLTALAPSGPVFTLFRFASGIGVGMASLVSPMYIRGAAMAVAVFAQWIANWVVTFTFPSLLNQGPSVAYLIYAVFAAISIYFVVRFITETKRRTRNKCDGAD